MSKKPTELRLKKLADKLGISLSDSVLNDYLKSMTETWESYEHVSGLEAPKDTSPYTRENIHEPKDNPYGAWFVKAKIKGASSGKLKGKTFAIKDNTNVAGVPMMNGAHSLSHYVPRYDATIVRRILDAGGTILGKAHCECLCFSGSSFTNAKTNVLNPHDKTRSSGGSSSGSAVLVQTNEVDMATGGDQGGSIRIPASWSGICGMKPSYGLVPYTGLMPIEYTLDHTGPMTKTVSDNALLLEVLAGFDNGLDTRQHPFIESKPYTQSLNKNISHLKIGILKQGFDRASSEKVVDECVRESAHFLSTLGASVKEVDCPLHLEAPTLWTVIAIDGAVDRMMRDDAYGSNDKGLYDIHLMEAHHSWRDEINTFPDVLKLSLMTGYLSKDIFKGISYAKAQNRVRALKSAYDRLLSEVDILIMPTTPMRAQLLPTAETSLLEKLNKSLEMTENTSAFNLTGHPAMSIPCGTVEGLPVGMMLVGRYFDEGTIYQMADAFEKNHT